MSVFVGVGIVVAWGLYRRRENKEQREYVMENKGSENIGEMMGDVDNKEEVINKGEMEGKEGMLDEDPGQESARSVGSTYTLESAHSGLTDGRSVKEEEGGLSMQEFNTIFSTHSQLEEKKGDHEQQCTVIGPHLSHPCSTPNPHAHLGEIHFLIQTL